ncbi:hypothetical protein ACTFIR_005073 [Dictyostelium discoideum]
MNHYPGEKTIKSGNLYKKGKINKSWQKRWCMLSKDSKLFYHKQANEKHTGFVDLRQCIIKQSDCTEKENIFEINTSNRIYLFSADSKSEMEDWMRSIYTHSKVQQENDLIERAEYIIRDQSLFKSNYVDDEFLKFKNTFNPYIFQSLSLSTLSPDDLNNHQHQQHQQHQHQHHQQQHQQQHQNDSTINSNLPSSLLSFSYHHNNNNNNNNNNNDNDDNDDIEIHPPTLSSYIPISTRNLYNHFHSIGNHEYNHPMDLIIHSSSPTPQIPPSNNNNNNNNNIVPSVPTSPPTPSSPPIGSLTTTTMATTTTTTSTTTTTTMANNSNIKETDKATPSRRFSLLFK